MGAMLLRCYPCDEDSANGGVLAELAIAPGARRNGLGTKSICALSAWIQDQVPGAHVAADVCSKNVASLGLLQSAGWRQTHTYEGCNGRHKCDEVTFRFCANDVH